MSQQVYETSLYRDCPAYRVMKDGDGRPPVNICEGLEVGANVQVGSVETVMQALGLHWTEPMTRYCDRKGKLVRFLGDDQVNAFVEFINKPPIEGADIACYTVPSCCLSLCD
eukprot:TRINITY_DN820_c0_g1_i3.p1 TRINITY_DN820_c0_g1~~TRINITY_DN820_c0_g1_i3.p1  ORF type:complete len:112 (+),score=3.69 TRINITY_DN820_c0_g1_i3:88-423(+)